MINAGILVPILHLVDVDIYIMVNWHLSKQDIRHQYHVTILEVIEISSLSFKLTADQLLNFDWIAGSIVSYAAALCLVTQRSSPRTAA